MQDNLFLFLTRGVVSHVKIDSLNEGDHCVYFSLQSDSRMRSYL